MSIKYKEGSDGRGPEKQASRESLVSSSDYGLQGTFGGFPQNRDTWVMYWARGDERGERRSVEQHTDLILGTNSQRLDAEREWEGSGMILRFPVGGTSGPWGFQWKAGKSGQVQLSREVWVWGFGHVGIGAGQCKVQILAGNRVRA